MYKAIMPLIAIALAFLVWNGLEGSSQYQIQWEKSYGGIVHDTASNIIETMDGGYLVVGDSSPLNNDFEEAIVYKIDTEGNLIWNKVYNGFGRIGFDEAVATKDGGYLLAGYKWPNDVGEKAAWVLKIDGNGNPMWNKAYGDSVYSGAYSIITTEDGGYLLAGYRATETDDADMWDMWAQKIDAQGNALWDKAYGGSKYDRANDLISTKDGGYLLVGVSMSMGDEEGDMWVQKIDAFGNPMWDRAYGDDGNDGAAHVVATKDDGFLLVGTVASQVDGGDDWGVQKIDANGNPQWNKSFGGQGSDRASEVIATVDGGYLVVGDVKIEDDTGMRWHMWVQKLDKQGSLQWDKIYAGKGSGAESVLATKDGGYLVAGSAYPHLDRLDSDMLVVKLMPKI